MKHGRISSLILVSLSVPIILTGCGNKVVLSDNTEAQTTQAVESTEMRTTSAAGTSNKISSSYKCNTTLSAYGFEKALTTLLKATDQSAISGLPLTSDCYEGLSKKLPIIGVYTSGSNLVINHWGIASDGNYMAIVTLTLDKFTYNYLINVSVSDDLISGVNSSLISMNK